MNLLRVWSCKIKRYLLEAHVLANSEYNWKSLIIGKDGHLYRNKKAKV